MTEALQRRVVLVTGLAGAGMSTALKALEDIGYEAVDNLPLGLLEPLVTHGGVGPLAVGLDCRTRDFSAENLLRQLERLREHPGLAVRILYLEAEDEVLRRRFTETRRRHPLGADRPVSDGIQHERALVEPLRDAADVMLDTSQLSIHDTRRLVSGNFALDASPRLQVFVTSFAFRQGVPREADLVFDVRFLANPHWDPELRPLTGRDPGVAAFVEADPEFGRFLNNLLALLGPLLPRYNQEGKSYLTLAIGCTGGKHRSVYVAERLAEWMRGEGYPVGLVHRELRV